MPSKFYMRSHLPGFLQEPRHITGVLVFNPSTEMFPCLDSITLALSRASMKEINGCAELSSSVQMIHLCIPLAVLQIMQHYLFARMEGNLTLQVTLHGPLRSWSKKCLLTLKALSYSSPLCESFCWHTWVSLLGDLGFAVPWQSTIKD